MRELVGFDVVAAVAVFVLMGKLVGKLARKLVGLDVVAALVLSRLHELVALLIRHVGASFSMPAFAEVAYTTGNRKGIFPPIL